MDAQVSKLRVTRCCWRCYSPCRRSSSGLTPLASTSDEDGDSSGRDAIFVAAAGNENTSASRYPAAEDGALAVTLVDQERKKSSFANYGGWVDAT